MVGSSVGGSVTETADSPVTATEGLEMEMEMADGSVTATATEGLETETEGLETETVDSSVTATEDSLVTATEDGSVMATEDGSVGGSVTVEDGPATAIRSSVSAEVGVTGVVTVVRRSASGEGGSTTEKGVEAADNSSDSRTAGRDVNISGGRLPRGLRRGAMLSFSKKKWKPPFGGNTQRMATERTTGRI